jgi:copper transport protein
VRHRRFLVAFLAVCAAGLIWASVASAHALLVGTSPPTGTTVKTQPPEVIFKFNQAVGGTEGAVRVYNAQGDEVDNLDVGHPNGQQSWMGVGLKPNLPDGTYTGTYRVISADTHIVYGGLVFNIGHAGAPPKYTVANLISKGESGEVTKLAFGAVRFLDYLSIALMIGGLLFVAAAWLPGLASVAGPEQRWSASSVAFARRIKRLFLIAIVLGMAVSLLGILLQGASAAGVSLWASLKHPIISDTLYSRFGKTWGLRLIDWAALGAVLAGARITGRDLVPVLAPGGESARGVALGPRPPAWLLGLVALGAGYLAMTPALGGHASVQGPTLVFFPSDVIHVLSASIWVGGIVCLLAVLPAATRELEPTERGGLLLATLVRFSPLALGAVIAIAITGVVQAYIDVRSISALFNTTYGLLVVAKVVLLSALIAIGAVNRRRLIPALKRLIGAGQPPGDAGVRARRNFRGELALMMTVFGVTAALVSYAPPIDAASGPFSTNTTLGPTELEMTVDPAKVGLNTIHIYLINAKDGSQFTGTKKLTVTASLPSKQIGPLPLTVSPTGPGHYTLAAAQLTPGGSWEINLTDLVSAFTEYTKTISVKIR